MREIENSNLKIKPYIIKREISEYNEEKVSEDREEFASASFLRSELEKILDEFSKEKFDFEKIKNFIAEKKYNSLKDVRVENSKEIEKV